jgi:hypothetical protein
MNDRGSGRPEMSFAERRRQADWVVKMATILSLTSWFIAIMVTLVLEYAAPERENLMSAIFEITVRTEWNQALLPVAFGLLVLSLITCIAALIFNMLRMRRKTDKFRKSIIIIGLLNFVGIIAFMIQFAPYLI